MIKKKIKKIKYDYDLLAIKHKQLRKYVYLNNSGQTTIDFKNQQAKIELNKALILTNLNLKYWDIPQQNLCPTYDSRKNYIDFIKNLIQKKDSIGIDIGTGSSLIYPIIGNKLYNMKFIASEIDQESYENCLKIIEENQLKQIQVKLVNKNDQIFDFIDKKINYDFSICNPPFFDSNIEQDNFEKSIYSQNEGFCEGGEYQFIQQLFNQSKNIQNVEYFTSLVGLKQNFDKIIEYLNQQENLKVLQHFIYQGNNQRFIIGWKFNK